VRLGLAEKAPDPDDRRATVLSLTDIGRESIAAVRSFRRQALDLLLGGWSAEELETFAALLGKFNGTVDHWESGAVPEEISTHPLGKPGA
jgi:DNA-binding MarR family transcriptional regulator